MNGPKGIAIALDDALVAAVRAQLRDASITGMTVVEDLLFVESVVRLEDLQNSPAPLRYEPPC